MNPNELINALKWNDDGLIPAIVQDASTNEVLMMAWMNQAALAHTLETGETYFYSRSRKREWHKGERSGHVQRVVEIRVDCDADVLLLRVSQTGSACHEGYPSCFYRTLDENGTLIINTPRAFDPEKVYSN